MAENIYKEVPRQKFKMEINIPDDAHIKQEFENQEEECQPIDNTEPGQGIKMTEGKDLLKSPKKEVLDTVTIDEVDYKYDLNEDIDLGTAMVGDSNMKMEHIRLVPEGIPSSAKKVKLSQKSNRNGEPMNNLNKPTTKLLILTEKKKKKKWSGQRVDVAGDANVVQCSSFKGSSNMHEPLSSELPSKRRVRFSQLSSLYEFLRDNRTFAVGTNKTTYGREMHQMMWQTVADCLNAHNEGSVKDWRAWAKYWTDYKSRLKNKVASQKRNPSETDLSDIDMKFLQLLEPAPELFEPVEVIHTDRTKGECGRIPSLEPHTFRTSPVAGPSSEIPVSLLLNTAQKNPTVPPKLRYPNTSSHTSTPNRPDTPPRRLEIPLRRPETPPKRPNTPPRRSETPTPRRTDSPETHTPHQSKDPVRRRRRHREVMTVEEARQRLVANSETRLQLERDRNDILRSILREFRTLNRNFEVNGNSRQRFYRPTEDEGN